MMQMLIRHSALAGSIVLAFWFGSLAGITPSIAAQRDSISAKDSDAAIRPLTGAGTVYPEKPAELFRTVERMMTAEPTAGCRNVRAILVPTNGYGHSGNVAAASLKEIGTGFRRVFILTANRSSEATYRGVSIPHLSHYRIPSADIPLSSVTQDLKQHPLVVNELPAQDHHVIESLLPFLHYLKGMPSTPSFSIVPMVLGKTEQSEDRELARVLQRYTDAQTLFIFAADLGPAGSGRQARSRDMQTIQSVLSLDSGALSRMATVDSHVLLTMVQLAHQNRWEPAFLKYDNSYQTAGPGQEGVGSAGIVFHLPLSLTERERLYLLSTARSAINRSVSNLPGDGKEEAAYRQYPVFSMKRGVFVTLEKHGRLRGCIGELFPGRTLYSAVNDCAIKAATQDPRFRKVTQEEMADITISISILTFPRRLESEDPRLYADLINPGKDGIILDHRDRQSTFLPKVWESIPKPSDFLSQLCLKQGSPAGCWRDNDTVLYHYNAYGFSE